VSQAGVAVAITPLSIPENPDTPDAADFRAMVGVRNRVSSALYGADALDAAPQQVLPTWAEQTDVALHGWLVRAEDEVVGRVVLDMPRDPGSRRAMIRVEVVPEAWERGYGRAAMAFAEERASEFGRTVLQAMTVHPAGAEPTLVPRSGAGAVPEDRFARFLLSFGYALEQVYRISTLDLTRPVEGFDALLADAREASAGYRYVSWTSPTPDEWIDDYAWMKSRMSTDAPTADMRWTRRPGTPRACAAWRRSPPGRVTSGSSARRSTSRPAVSSRSPSCRASACRASPSTRTTRWC